MGLEQNDSRKKFSDEGEILAEEGREKSKQEDTRSIQEVLDRALASEPDSVLRKRAEEVLKNAMVLYPDYFNNQAERRKLRNLLLTIAGIIAYTRVSGALNAELILPNECLGAIFIVTALWASSVAIGIYINSDLSHRMNDLQIEAGSLGLNLRKREMHGFMEILYRENKIRSLDNDPNRPWTKLTLGEELEEENEVDDEKTDEFEVDDGTLVDEASKAYFSVLIQGSPDNSDNNREHAVRNKLDDEDEDDDDDEKKDRKKWNRKYKKND